MMIDSFNPFDILLNFFNVLSSFATIIYNFLFQEITIGSWTFQPFFVLGTGVIVTLIIARIVKLVIPGL